MRNWIIAGAAIAALAGGGWYYMRDDCNGSAAYAAFKSEMAQHLKAPSTAIYQPWEQVSKRMMDTCIFQISGYVESQNSFGAMGKTTFSGYARGSDGEFDISVSQVNGKVIIP